MLAGNVSIHPPYSPALYVKAGEEFNITCKSNGVKKLLWFRNTKNGRLNIDAKIGGEFEMTWIEKQPSGDVLSILIKKAASISDSGEYTCHDDGNNGFYITITVLYILTTQETKDSLNISCYIAGFTMNYPNIGHTWRVNGSDIASSSTAYNMTGRQEFMSIQKTNPVREDSANYECVYTFATNIKVINITKSIHFNASAFPPAKGTAAESKMSWLFCWVIAIVIISKIH
ncbi:hypothetical protein LSAT2_011213 [Lamellibrachia satsuma]|nr:hypothetical protein LSAT2_011213 [Lamellibrachia satsuma]